MFDVFGWLIIGWIGFIFIIGAILVGNTVHRVIALVLVVLALLSWFGFLRC